MKKHGFTLVELVVAMGIFMIVITLAVGAYVTISRMEALSSTMKEVQQKTRIATEMITRLSRQSNKATLDTTGTDLALYFNTTSSNVYGSRFLIKDNTLYYYECPSANIVALTCSDWGASSDLLGGSVELDQSSKFVKTGTIPPKLEVYLNGKIVDINNSAYYSDQMTIDTETILEGIK